MIPVTLSAVEDIRVTVASEVETMARKKSEVRRHTAMMRVDAVALERAKLAASLMKMSLADYASDILKKQADKDIGREAKKLAGGSEH